MIFLYQKHELVVATMTSVCVANLAIQQNTRQYTTHTKPNYHMSNDTQADMPPSSLAKAIKFGPFTVTSQVHLSFRLPPLPLPHLLNRN